MSVESLRYREADGGSGMSRYAHLAFTETVQRFQKEQGSHRANLWKLSQGSDRGSLGDEEKKFIESRDSFYIASVSETGWPYVQHRGGPPGFLRALDEYNLSYVEMRGNRQYITDGNILSDGRVSLFLIDYPRQLRLKIFGRARLVPIGSGRELGECSGDIPQDGKPERVVEIAVEGFDWNCSKYITPRFSREELRSAIEPMRTEIVRLRRENEKMRKVLFSSDE